MPSIGAGLVATLAGWILDSVLDPVLGVGPTLIVSFAASTIIFFMARQWLKRLRDG